MGKTVMSMNVADIFGNLIGKTLYYRNIGNIFCIITIKGFEKAGEKYESDSFYGDVVYLYPNDQTQQVLDKFAWACEKRAFECNVRNGKYNHLIDEDTLNLLTELQFKRGEWISNEQITQVKALLQISGEEDPRVLLHLRNMIVSFFADKLKETPMNDMELINSLSAITAVLDTTLQHF